MKISLAQTMKLFSTGMIAFSIALLTTQVPVQAYSVKLAQAATDAQMVNLQKELTRRSDELKKSTESLNGQLSTTGTGTGTATGATTKDAKECADGDKNTEQAITKVNKDSADASKGIQDMLTQSKQSGSTTTTKQQATKADAQYDEYKVANAQNNIMNAVCTQKDAQSQLESLIQQAQQKQSESAESSGSGSSGDSGGGGDMDITSMIQKVIQLVAAVAAIIASVVALVQAIQKGDYAAAAAILATVVGQLAAAANILLDGEGEITDIIESLDTITN